MPTRTPAKKASSSKTTKPRSRAKTPKAPATAASTSSTTRMTTTAPKVAQAPQTPAQKTVPLTTAPAPVDVPETSVVNVMKKKELIEKVTEASGVKRSEAKKAIEATLKILGDSLQEGTELNLPPLGKMSINRQREAAGAYVTIAKLRRSKAMLSDAPKAPETDIPQD